MEASRPRDLQTSACGLSPGGDGQLFLFHVEPVETQKAKRTATQERTLAQPTGKLLGEVTLPVSTLILKRPNRFGSVLFLRIGPISRLNLARLAVQAGHRRIKNGNPSRKGSKARRGHLRRSARDAGGRNQARICHSGPGRMQGQTEVTRSGRPANSPSQ